MKKSTEVVSLQVLPQSNSIKDKFILNFQNKICY